MKKIILIIGALVAVAGMFAAAYALYTASTTISGNTVSTGTIDLSTSPATALIVEPAFMPGDSHPYDLTLNNTGSADLRVSAITNSNEDVLSAALSLTVNAGTCASAGAHISGPEPFGSTTQNDVLFGDPTAGQQPGDQVIVAGASESLCVHLSLPIDTTVGQGVTSNAVFTFQSEQVSNNP